MASKKDKTEEAPATALAKSETSALAFDPLADVLGGAELATTGTEGVGAKVRMPAWVINTKFVPPDGDGSPITPNTFLNTVTEQPARKLRLQVLTADRGREWSERDAEDKKVVHCRSWDGHMGNLRHPDGTITERACKGCPDYAWRKVDGKNTRSCGDTLRVVAIDLDTGDAGVLPLRKTAVKPFDEFYQKEFYRKRPGAAGQPRQDMPFFAFETIVDAAMVKGGQYTWAQARFAKGALLDRATILAGAAAVLDYREHKRAMVEDAMEAAEDGSSEGDTSFGYGANEGGGEGGGDRFVDAGMG